MFVFSEYKKLTRETRSMATLYWAEVVKQRLGASCPNQILAHHLSPEETAIPGWSNNSSRYWNKMLKGEPASRESKIDHTESILPGTKAILLHPLWQLVNTNKHDNILLNKALLALPSELHSKLFKTDMNGVMSRKKTVHKRFLIKLYAENSLDALTCLLALALEARPISGSYEMGFLKVFLRLSALTELNTIYQALYQRVSSIINCSTADYERLRTPSPYGLPLQILPNDRIHIEELVWSYLRVLDIAIKAGLIADQKNEKLIFLHSINHSSFWIEQDDLIDLGNGLIDETSLDKTTQQTIKRVNYYLKKQR